LNIAVSFFYLFFTMAKALKSAYFAGFERAQKVSGGGGASATPSDRAAA
jgi:hypothetical protein